MSIYSMARISRLNLLELQLAEVHARRGDERSQRRQICDAPPVTWLPEGAEGDPLALETRYADHITGAFIPAGRGKALHLLVKFPEAVSVGTHEEAEAALKLAVDFAQATFGGNAVFAARMDRDEKSLTNADLFLAPRYMKKTKHTEKVAISLSRHLKLMAEKRGPLPKDQDILRAQGQALQDAFAEFLRARGYQALRGQPKRTVEPDWISPEAYGVSVDRKIAAADRDVAADEYRQAALDRDVTAKDRADLEIWLAAREQDLDQKDADIVTRLEDAQQAGQQMIDAGSNEGRRILGDANEAADAISKKAEADAARIRATAVEQAEYDAQVIRDRATIDATAMKTAADKAAAEVCDLGDKVKLAADAVAERERKIALATDRISAEQATVAEAASKAKNDVEDAKRRLARAEAVQIEVQADQAIAAQARADADIASRQLALIGRAMQDEALAMVADQSDRGVSMNEQAMHQRERETYRAPWSEMVRAIAQSAAVALARARAIIAAAIGEASHKLNEAAKAIINDRQNLDGEKAILAAAKIQFARDRRALRDQQVGAQAFLDAWSAIPPEQRTPMVNETITRAAGVMAQAAALPAGKAASSNAGPKTSELPMQDPRERTGAGR